ncbi:MAG TPA: hypothetical protein VMW68_04440 [Methyloceanibacter sp.]|nr:hypothetical protein [Methyloceanibacter sp.]
MNAASKRAEAMARALASGSVDGRGNPFFQHKIGQAEDLAAAMDAYFANTRFVEQLSPAHGLRFFKPEPIDER